MTGRVECIFDGICHLAEGPLWNVERQQLFWTDILNKRVWVYDPATRQSRLFWQGPHMVGGFAFTRNGGMMFCTDSGVYRLPPEKMGQVDAELENIFIIPMVPGERFNDITTDPEGRIFAGTLRPDSRNGALYRLERNKAPAAVLQGIECTNGMTFSIDQQWFFHTDSLKRTITRYRYCRNTGELSEPAVMFQGTPAQGLPDGITLDTEDHLWVAFWDNARVRRITPQGRVVAEIPIPAVKPSSVMFGGKHLSDLYITTACQGAFDLERGLDEHGVFQGGHVYRFTTDFQGRPEWPANFD